MNTNNWFYWCGNFNKGFARIRREDGGFTYIKSSGEFIVDAWFVQASDFLFENALFRVMTSERKWLWMDKKGVLYDACGRIREGFVRVESRGKWNYIDKEGNVLSSTWFDDCDEFKEGFARVILNEKWNFLGKDGKYLSDVWLKDDFSRVMSSKKLFYINKEGGLHEY